MHFLQHSPFLGKLQACHFAPVMLYLRCRTRGLDGSTATGPLLSATRGDPASSSVRRWVETARREEDADEEMLSILDWSAAG